MQRFSSYTLIETMFAISIAAVLIVTASKPLLEFHHIAVQQNEQSIIHAEYIRFLIMFKSELIQAGYHLKNQNSAIRIEQETITLKKDLNRDGDTDDSFENIVYRFFPEQQKLSRKSGAGNFQILIQPLWSVQFDRLPLQEGNAPAPKCIVITSQMSQHIPVEQTTLCPLLL